MPSQPPLPSSGPSTEPAPPPPAGTGTPGSTGGPGADAAAGITGITVAIGHCPVVKDESSCADIPFPASFMVVDVGSGVAVTSVHSGSDGRFRVAVRPGRYLLRAPLMLPRAAPMPVTVDAGRYTPVTMRFDTGVR